jgi:hypothetical protein
MEKRFNTAEAAMYLGYKNHQTLANMRSEGRGPVYYKMGGRVFYLQSDLDSYQRSQRIVPENKK